jgi:SOS-response transcriptional repressor LexA
MKNNPMDNEITKKNLNTLSERLVHALNLLGVTKAELSRRIGVKPQAIHYLCTSNSKKSSFTYEIADALKINSLWLGSGDGSMLLEENQEEELVKSQKRTPVIDWRQVKQLISDEASNIISSSKEWLLTSLNLGENGFAFRLHDRSIYPRFDQDTLIIINPNREPKNKDFVVAYLKEADDIVFRQYEIENNIVYLKPINTSMYKIIEKKNEDVILGVMVEARWQAQF